MTIAIVTFGLALAAIATDRINKTIVALVGGVVVVATQTITQEHAIEAIDFNTIGLLVGMMLIVTLTETTGVYTYLAIRAGQLAGGKSWAIMWSVAGATAILSAFLDNLTTVLLMVPITFLLADALDLDALPLVIVEIIASNIGGTATLIGDPPNIMIAGASGLSFNQFLTNLAPLAIVAFLASTAFVYLAFRRRLFVLPQNRERLMDLDARRSIEDPSELKRALPVLLGTLGLFFVHRQLHLEPATVALLGATVMLIITKQDLGEALGRIEWPTLFFFMGLFVMVGALVEEGVVRDIANGVADLTGGNRSSEIIGIVWGSAVGSALVDNIPLTAAMIPVVDQLQQGSDNAYWWALSIGACFGGNFTLVAAAANVAASAISARSGCPIPFGQFFRVGAPVTILSLVIGTGYIALRYL